ncbi:Ig-like domain-containing protein, partial [Bacillus cereus group sp. LD113LC]
MNGNSTDYTGTVKADGTYSINVPGSELVADADSTIVASVSGTDEAGNPFTATTETSGDNKDGGYEVDTGISKPTIDLVASSDSGKEDAHGSDTDNLTNDTTPTFTFGNIDDDVEKVEVFNGTTLLGEAVKVEGVWTFTATDGQLTEGANSITVKATDDAGNSDTSDALAVTIDTDAAATITIDDDIAGDDIVNAAEAAGDVTITGTVGGDAKEGDTVTLTVNGNSTDYTGTVKADGTY